MSCRPLRQAIIPGKTKLVMLESPTNPRMQICDIAALTAIAHEVSPPHFSCAATPLALLSVLLTICQEVQSAWGDSCGMWWIRLALLWWWTTASWRPPSSSRWCWALTSS